MGNTLNTINEWPGSVDPPAPAHAADPANLTDPPDQAGDQDDIPILQLDVVHPIPGIAEQPLADHVDSQVLNHASCQGFPACQSHPSVTAVNELPRDPAASGDGGGRGDDGCALAGHQNAEDNGQQGEDLNSAVLAIPPAIFDSTVPSVAVENLWENSVLSHGIDFDRRGLSLTPDPGATFPQASVDCFPGIHLPTLVQEYNQAKGFDDPQPIPRAYLENWASRLGIENGEAEAIFRLIVREIVREELRDLLGSEPDLAKSLELLSGGDQLGISGSDEEINLDEEDLEFGNYEVGTTESDSELHLEELGSMFEGDTIDDEEEQADRDMGDEEDDDPEPEKAPRKRSASANSESKTKKSRRSSSSGSESQTRAGQNSRRRRSPDPPASRRSARTQNANNKGRN